MLQELFNILDLPGSSVRDVLAGEDPFDQWASPLSDDYRTSGAQLVNKWTGADENSWGGMLGGMGAEMLLDPMNLLPGFGVMKRALAARRATGLNRGIRAANEAQQALDAGRYGYVNAGRLAGGAEEAAAAAPGPVQQRLLGYDPGVTENFQKVSHGTSNPFAGSDDFPAGKLDLRYMGTGEGNQAFGWGSYSAQTPDVAKGYEKYGGSASGPISVPTPIGKAVLREARRRLDTPASQRWIERRLPNPARESWVNKSDVEEARRRLLSDLSSNPYHASLMLEETGQPGWLRRAKQEAGRKDILMRTEYPPDDLPKGPFHMQLNLPKEAEDRMIRGDVTLAEQPPLVQQALQEVQQDINLVAQKAQPFSPRFRGLVDISLDEEFSDSPISIQNVAGTDIVIKKLEHAYRRGLLQDTPEIAGRVPYKDVPKKVAEYLQSKGIVGNKFLDRKSRRQFEESATADIEFDSPLPSEMKDTVEGFARQEVEFAADEIKALGGLTKSNVIPSIRHNLIKKLNGITFYLDRVEEGSDMYAHLLRNEKNVRAALQLLRDSPPKVIVKTPSLSQPGYTSNYAIWDQPTLDKTRIRKINGVNIPLANMLKGGRARPTEAALDLVQSTQPMGSPLMQELPVPSLLSRKEALALGIYNVAARGGFTVE